jgi:DNA-binding transcriptional LysR family regulator
MDIHQLELFLAVIESPTLTQAAAKMHLSPSAVSLQIHALAGELATELFVRSGKRLRPTPAAERLAQHARKVLADMRQIRNEFETEAESDTRPFYFATGATTLIYRLGQPFRQLRRMYPKLDLHVTVLATEEIMAGVLNRQFDLGLISLPVNEPQLHIVPLFEEEMLVIKPSATRVRGHHVTSISAAKLRDARFILYPPHSNMRRLIENFLVELKINPHITMEAADTEAIKGVVESGFGCSMLPEYALREPVKYFQTLRIDHHRLVRVQALAMPESAYRRALTESVATFLKRTFDPNNSLQ